jgi:Outer membrane lipoprotein-sorting protein
MTMTHLPPDDGFHDDDDGELRALTQLFDAVAPSGRAEAEEELLDAGVDPQRVGQRLALLAQRAVAGSAGTPPANAGAHSATQRPRRRVRPLYVSAVAALALLALGGLTLLRFGARQRIEPRETNDAVITNQPQQDHPALRLRSQEEPADEASGAGRGAVGAPKAQQQPPRPSRGQHAGGAAVENLPSEALPPDAPLGSAAVSTAAAWIDAVARAARVFRDTTQQLQMTVDEAGGKQVMHFQLQTKFFEGDVFKAVIHFESPPENGVTALLLEWADEAAGDPPAAVPLKAWAYRPSLRRVYRLTALSCAVSDDVDCLDLLLPGEFLPWAVANWNATSLEPPPGAALTIEVMPPPGLTLPLPLRHHRLRLRLWPDATLREVEFYDERNRLAKTLLLSDFRSIDGVPVAHRLEMVNAFTAGRTSLDVVSFRHDENLPGDLFTIAHLIGDWR